MTTVVLMKYILYNVDIDTAIGVVTQLKSARDSLTSKYPALDFIVGFFPSRSGRDLSVRIQGQESGTVEEATREYLRGLALKPNFVDAESDYNLMKRVLREFGKTLKWRFEGGMVGKHVVPLPAHYYGSPYD